MRNRRLQRIQKIIEAQKRVSPELYDQRFFSDRQLGRVRAVGPIGRCWRLVRVGHLATVWD